jgi:hypothetical protein
LSMQAPLPIHLSVTMRDVADPCGPQKSNQAPTEVMKYS